MLTPPGDIPLLKPQLESTVNNNNHSVDDSLPCQSPDIKSEESHVAPTFEHDNLRRRVLTELHDTMVNVASMKAKVLSQTDSGHFPTVWKIENPRDGSVVIIDPKREQPQETAMPIDDNTSMEMSHCHFTNSVSSPGYYSSIKNDATEGMINPKLEPQIHPKTSCALVAGGRERWNMYTTEYPNFWPQNKMNHLQEVVIKQEPEDEADFNHFDMPMSRTGWKLEDEAAGNNSDSGGTSLLLLGGYDEKRSKNLQAREKADNGFVVSPEYEACQASFESNISWGRTDSLAMLSSLLQSDLCIQRNNNFSMNNNSDPQERIITDLSDDSRENNATYEKLNNNVGPTSWENGSHPVHLLLLGNCGGHDSSHQHHEHHCCCSKNKTANSPENNCSSIGNNFPDHKKSQLHESLLYHIGCTDKYHCTGNMTCCCKSFGKHAPKSVEGGINQQRLCRHKQQPGRKMYYNGTQNSCSYCDRRFRSKSAKVIHERIHTGEKPFGCTHCAKCFKSNYEKVIHERTHTGERPYACTTCHKSFTSLSYRKIHERIHSGERPYLCPRCDKRFKSLREVKVHEVIHAGQ